MTQPKGPLPQRNLGVETYDRLMNWHGHLHYHHIIHHRLYLLVCMELISYHLAHGIPFSSSFSFIIAPFFFS
jgi:hypothetical protein